MAKKPIKVVLSGSGILYPLHAGALNALTTHGFKIKEIVGVSGGAIVGGAVASGYSPGPELDELLAKTLPGPNDLLDPGWLPLWNWGYYKGDKILNQFQKYMVKDFDDTTIPFKAVSVNVNTKRVEDGTRFTVPKAVRASMTFPFVFEPVEDENGHKYVDGGLNSYFPIDWWDNSKNTIGFQVRSDIVQTDKLNKSGYCGILGYARALVGSMLHSLNREHIEDAKFARTVMLKSNKYAPLDLKIDKPSFGELLKTGYNQAYDQIEQMKTEDKL